MLKLNFRFLFVFFLLTNIFLGRVLSFDRSIGLFEREKITENCSSKVKTDGPDKASLHTIITLAPDSSSTSPVINEPVAADNQSQMMRSLYIISYTCRGPPLIG